MKKEYKILSILLLGLVAVSMIAGIVSAAWSPTDLTDSLKNLFSGNGDFLTNLLTPPILFGVLVFLIVFAVASNLPFLKSGKEWVKVGVAIVVALLAGVFMPKEIYLPLVNQYSALGITISFVLPFILIFYFIKEAMPRNLLLQRLVWIIYTIFLILSYIGNYQDLGKTANWIYIGMCIASGVMILWGGKILEKLWAEELQEAIQITQEAELTSALNEVAKREQALTNVRGLTPAQRAEIEYEIQELKNRIRNPHG
jgi:Flp pilus assembly pilin Flp